MATSWQLGSVAADRSWVGSKAKRRSRLANWLKWLDWLCDRLKLSGWFDCYVRGRWQILRQRIRILLGWLRGPYHFNLIFLLNKICNCFPFCIILSWILISLSSSWTTGTSLIKSYHRSHTCYVFAFLEVSTISLAPFRPFASNWRLAAAAVNILLVFFLFFLVNN